jgi:threonine dehydratase
MTHKRHFARRVHGLIRPQNAVSARLDRVGLDMTRSGARHDIIVAGRLCGRSWPPSTIADGVAGRYVPPDVLSDLRGLATDTFLVSEESIKEGMLLLYRCSGLIVEPSAGLGVAAILANQRFRGRTVATIVCGSGIAPADFERWVVQCN